MTNALLSYYTTDVADYQQVADLTLPGREEYCSRHGYSHIVHNGRYKGLNLYYAIERLYMIRDIMFVEPNPPDLMWVLNIQSLITNLTISFEQYAVGDFDFWIGRDCNAINAGSFLIRRSDWSRQWLDMLIELAPKCGAPWWENQAMINTYQQSPWQERISVVDQRQFNAYLYHAMYGMSNPGEWQPGDLALSLPGTNLEQRLGAIKGHLPKVVR